MNVIKIAMIALTLAPIAAHAAPTSTFSVQQSYVLGGAGKWDYLNLDSVGRRLYITRGNRVMVMDIDSGKLVGEVLGAVGAHGVALVPDLKRGYVSNGDGNSLTPFDLVALKSLPPIAVSGKKPDSVIFDAATSHVWAFNGHSGTASVVDPVNTKEIASVALPGKPETAVTDDAGHIFVNLEDVSKISEIDAHTYKVLATWSIAPCDGPTGLALDVAHHRLFSACANQKLVVTDATDGHQVAVLPIGTDPDAAGFDTDTKNVFSSNRDGTLTVIHQNDADHYVVIANVKTDPGARTMAIDAKTHEVFLVAPDVTTAAKGIVGTHTFGTLVVGSP